MFDCELGVLPVRQKLPALIQILVHRRNRHHPAEASSVVPGYSAAVMGNRHDIGTIDRQVDAAETNVDRSNIYSH